jgi:hypothetical protein
MTVGFVLTVWDESITMCNILQVKSEYPGVLIIDYTLPMAVNSKLATRNWQMPDVCDSVAALYDA